MIATYVGNSEMVASGGGGAGGAGDGNEDGYQGCGGGGGGGGGIGGGAGGSGSVGYGGGGFGGSPNGVKSTTYSGGKIETIFGDYYCNGGGGAGNGRNGALKISYLGYGTGGSGGGGSSIVPIRPVEVTPKEILTVKIGVGDPGGTKGYMDASGNIIIPNKPVQYKASRTELNNIAEENLLTAVGGAEWCPHSGHPSGQIYGWGASPFYGHPGAVYDGFTLSSYYLNGFGSEMGHSANNGTTSGNIIFPNGSTGGDGGQTKLFGSTSHCTPGKGGTLSSPKGGDASGYGCGGGGGYGLADGGKGSGGYARLSWNKYWNAAVNAYRLADSGTGGGGASGNVMTYSLKVMSNQVIKIRIGKGGKGAEIVNNVVTNAQKGGDTIFGDNAIGELRAGGGYGGSSPSIVNNTLVNGVGGAISSVCHYGSKSYLNNKAYCTKGTKGLNATANVNENATAKGAGGASLERYGIGGEGGISGTSSYLGKPATGFGSGGGGAGIYDLGDNSISPTSGTNKGGAGSNGKIIIELYDM